MTNDLAPPDARLSEAQIAEIRARAEAATPGPWRQKTRRRAWSGGRHQKVAEVRSTTQDIYIPIFEHVSWYVYPSDQDLAFIAHSRTDIPLLLAERAATRALLREAHREWDRWERMGDVADLRAEKAQRWSALWKAGARHYHELWHSAIERDARHVRQLNKILRSYNTEHQIELAALRAELDKAQEERIAALQANGEMAAVWCDDQEVIWTLTDKLAASQAEVARLKEALEQTKTPVDSA